MIREEMLSWMVHTCLKQFRIDVLTTVKAEIREEHREGVMKGDRPFCRCYFEEVMMDGWMLRDVR